MPRSLQIFLLVLCLSLTGSFALLADHHAAGEAVDIPYTKHVLDNGLTVLIHEDPKAPIVAVNVWYHVGSKNEKFGKTGFAHLFEHLMFNGSENYNDDYFKPFSRVGATDMNGTTNFDRTNYFQNVPKTALDTALWMESDRMGHLLGAIDQDKLDEQRGVVQNEKRQGENQPYGKAFLTLFENSYPANHPYSHSVIGSLEDLDAASLDDVHEWFKQYYGPNNAVIAVAGDVDVEDVKQRVEKYFGHIPAGPPVIKHDAWEAPRTGEQRIVMQDRVPQARVYVSWNVATRNSADSDYLDLVSDVLANGKNSRLYKRLVYDDQIATDVSAFLIAREIGGMLVISATAQPGGDLGAVEKAIDEELHRFFQEGPTEDELERVRVGNRAGFVRGIERIGGFGGKSDILAQNEVYAGDPDFHKVQQTRVQTATADDLLGAAKRWLSDGRLVLEVRSFDEFANGEAQVDRSTGVPEIDEWPEVDFPDVQRKTLKNGLKIVLAQRDAVPVVNLNLMFNAGYTTDLLSAQGTASLAMNMLDEGTATRSSLEINDRLQRLGANLGTGPGLDTSTVSMSALKSNLDESLELFADVVMNPSFPANELDRLRKQQIARIQNEKKTPVQMALRVFPRLLYGEGHPYSLPFTGSGTEESVAALTRDDLAEFHKTWLRPNNATLMVVGDTTMDEISSKIEKLFADWKKGKTPALDLTEVDHHDKSVVYLIDRPDSIQSIIFAGHVIPPKANPNEIAIDAMNQVFGGSFNARLNMNLREDKHWSYGARSIVFDARGQRPMIVYAPVQTDKTKESLAEIEKEMRGILGDNPPSEEEVARAKDEQTLTLPGRWETAGAVLGSIVEMEQFGLPQDHWSTYAAKVRGLDQAKVSDAAKVLRPDNMVWVVVGDRAKIEEGVRELGLGEIRLIDASGNPVE